MDKNEIARSMEVLNERYPEPKANSFKSIGGSKEKPNPITNESYSHKGMKQSKFHFVRFISCVFDSTALTGSQFRHVWFKRSKIVGSSFACCDFYEVTFDGKGVSRFHANNFSLSTFERTDFFDIQFVNSGMLSSLFHNCVFENVVFRSSTLEGTKFLKCELNNCDLSSVNVEFVCIANSVLKNVSFPFYQFPYVIGAAKYLRDCETGIVLSAGGKTVSVTEYNENLDNLICFFADKNEYFPMCNLAIAKGDLSAAREYLMSGINAAMAEYNRDFRMVRYFCQLALYHDILDEQTRYKILSNLDEFLLQKDVPEQQLNYYMTYAGNIRTMLMAGGPETVTFHLSIKTNIKRDNASGIGFVNKLVQELNEALSEANGESGFQVSISNYSPFEIFIDVLTYVGSVASIASIIWMVIDAINRKRQKKAQIEFHKMVNSTIDEACSQLIKLQSMYSKRKYSKYITEITQQLKTDLDNLYSQNVMIFKVKNDHDPKGTD